MYVFLCIWIVFSCDCIQEKQRGKLSDQCLGGASVNGGPATREQQQGQDVRWDDLDSSLDWDQENLDQFSLCQNQEAISSTKCKQGRFQKGIYWVFIEKEGYLDHRSKPMSSSRQRRDMSCKDPIWGPGSRINYLENQFGEILSFALKIEESSDAKSRRAVTWFRGDTRVLWGAGLLKVGGREVWKLCWSFEQQHAELWRANPSELWCEVKALRSQS